MMSVEVLTAGPRGGVPVSPTRPTVGSAAELHVHVFVRLRCLSSRPRTESGTPSRTRHCGHGQFRARAAADGGTVTARARQDTRPGSRPTGLHLNCRMPARGESLSWARGLPQRPDRHRAGRGPGEAAHRGGDSDGWRTWLAPVSGRMRVRSGRSGRSDRRHAVEAAASGGLWCASMVPWGSARREGTAPRREGCRVIGTVMTVDNVSV